MIPAPFHYRRARSAAEALDLLSALGDEAKLLAGGQSLLPLLKLRLAAPETIIDINEVGDLAYVRDHDGVLAIGALTRHHELATDPVVNTRVPLLARAASLIGDPQIRHRGTIGGSCAHADPSADLPTALVALGAEFVVDGPSGRRQIHATEFFQGFLETVLAPDELLLEVRVPTVATGWAYEKFTRRSIDWATVSVAVAAGPQGVMVALGNMGSMPLRAEGVERALAAGEDARRAAEQADESTNPPADATASSEYRRHLARVLTARALAAALG